MLFFCVSLSLSLAFSCDVFCNVSRFVSVCCRFQPNKKKNIFKQNSHLYILYSLLVEQFFFTTDISFVGLVVAL